MLSIKFSLFPPILPAKNIVNNLKLQNWQRMTTGRTGQCTVVSREWRHLKGWSSSAVAPSHRYDDTHLWICSFFVLGRRNVQLASKENKAIFTSKKEIDGWWSFDHFKQSRQRRFCAAVRPLVLTADVRTYKCRHAVFFLRHSFKTRKALWNFFSGTVTHLWILLVDRIFLKDISGSLLLLYEAGFRDGSQAFRDNRWVESDVISKTIPSCPIKQSIKGEHASFQGKYLVRLFVWLSHTDFPPCRHVWSARWIAPPRRTKMTCPHPCWPRRGQREQETRMTRPKFPPSKRRFCMPRPAKPVWSDSRWPSRIVPPSPCSQNCMRPMIGLQRRPAWGRRHPDAVLVKRSLRPTPAPGDWPRGKIIIWWWSRAILCRSGTRWSNFWEWVSAVTLVLPCLCFVLSFFPVFYLLATA